MKKNNTDKRFLENANIYRIPGTGIVILDEPCETKIGRKGFLRLKHSAVKRDIEFEIATVEDLIVWWITTPEECAYCGVSEEDYNKITRIIRKVRKGNPFLRKLKGFLRHHQYSMMTYDRVDSNESYSLENLVKACHFCNSIKGFLLTKEETQYIGPRVLKRIKESIKYGKNESS